MTQTTRTDAERGINPVERFLINKMASPVFWTLVIIMTAIFFLSDKSSIILCAVLAFCMDTRWMERWMAFANPRIEKFFEEN